MAPQTRARGVATSTKPPSKVEKKTKVDPSKPSKEAPLPPGSTTSLGFTTSRKLSEEPDVKLSSKAKSETVKIVGENKLTSELIQSKNDSSVPSKRKRGSTNIKNEPKEEAPTPAKKQKKHPYGLTPGYSPFPDHVAPTAQDCRKVNELLSALHGEVKQPKVIPPPSSTVTGCGEVPDLVDALLRTLLSANTSNSNSAKALKGLINEFGSVGGSPDWEEVRLADAERVEHAIAAGGQQRIKSKYIKGILDLVYSQNLEVFKALSGNKQEDLQNANPTETKPENEKQDLKVDFNPLSLARIFEIQNTHEAMDELLKFPGIGVKTASCVIMFCMQRPSFAVDTHVQRMCQWLGWAPPGSSESNTFSHLEVRVPDELKYALHHLFIKHGQRCFRCRANTNAGTEGWGDSVCPLEGLVRRTGKMKELRVLAGKKEKIGSRKVESGKVEKSKVKKVKGKKRKEADTESEESEDAQDLESVASDELSNLEMSDGE